MIRFLAIGDSITRSGVSGSTPFYSYIGPLQSLLAQRGIVAQMLGPVQAEYGGGADPDCAAWGSASIDASGHPDNNVTSRLDLIFTPETQPDWMGLLIGWNDLFLGGGVASSAPSRWPTLYSSLRMRRAGAKVLACTLTPSNPPGGTAGWAELNDAIRATAAANSSTTVLADLAVLPFTSGDFVDYVHLAPSGADKVAGALVATMDASGWLAPAPTQPVSTRIFPTSVARSVAQAISTAPLGQKRAAGAQALSNAIGPNYRLRARRAGALVLDAAFQGSLPVSATGIVLPAYSTLVSMLAADIATPAYSGAVSQAGWVVRVGRADDSVYVEGGAGVGAPFAFSANLASDRGLAASVSLAFNPSLDG